MAAEENEQFEVVEQQPNVPKTPMEELLERVLQETGKTRAEFDAEVERERQQSPVEVMGMMVGMLMQNADMTAQMVGMVMMENTQLKSRITKLEGSR